MFKGITRFAGVAVIIAVVLGMKFYNKQKASSDVRKQAHELVTQFPAYAENKEFFDSSFDSLHQQAFDTSYTMGGRRTSSKFDEEKYLNELIRLMQQKASAEGRGDLAMALREYGMAFSAAAAAENQ